MSTSLGDVPPLLLKKGAAAELLGVGPRVLEGLAKRGDVETVRIPPVFGSSANPQSMVRFPLDSLREYVARLREESQSLREELDTAEPDVSERVNQ